MLTEYNKIPRSQVNKESRVFRVSTSSCLRQPKRKRLTKFQESTYALYNHLNCDLLNSDIRVFNTIIFYHNIYPQVIPSIQAIADRAGVCYGTARNAIKRLRNKNLLKVITRFRRTSIYSISEIFKHPEVRKILSRLFNNLRWWKEKTIDLLKSIPLTISKSFGFFSENSCSFWQLYKYTHLRSSIYSCCCCSSLLKYNSKSNFRGKVQTTTTTQKKNKKLNIELIKKQRVFPELNKKLRNAFNFKEKSVRDP